MTCWRIPRPDPVPDTHGDAASRPPLCERAIGTGRLSDIPAARGRWASDARSNGRRFGAQGIYVEYA